MGAQRQTREEKRAGTGATGAKAVTYDAALKERQFFGDDILLLRFQKPAGFSYKAGQFCFITAPDIGFNDEEGLRKPFSIASAPSEEEILFAIRMTDSAFKTALRQMELRGNVTLNQPVGTFTLPEDARIPLIFLAGGLGVAPFRSMIKEIAMTHTGHRVTLLYSCRSPEEAAFLYELESIAKKHRNIDVLATMTKEKYPADWAGLRGRITSAMVREACENWKSSLYYVSGPPAMVDGMRDMLQEIGIQRDSIMREVWSGF